MTQTTIEELFQDHDLRSDMNKILSLFDSEAFDKEILERQQIVAKTISKFMQNLSGEQFLSSFSDKAREDLKCFQSDGIIDPKNYPIDAHIGGLAKVLRDNNDKIQDIVQKHTKWEITQKNKIKKFDTKIDIKEELYLLNKMFPYDSHFKGWEFPTFNLNYIDDNGEEINVEFPGLYLQCNFDRKEVTRAVTIGLDYDSIHLEHTHEIPDSEKYCHPHIGTDNRICFGDATSAAQLFWERKELFNLAMLLSDTLGTYNHRSPYRELRYWTDKVALTCNNCGDYVRESDARHIDNNSEEIACRECSVYVQANNTFQWAHNYVKSVYANDNIPSSEASLAFVDDTNKDYIQNILADTNFRMCPKCNEFIHINYLYDYNSSLICKRCKDKTEVFV